MKKYLFFIAIFLTINFMAAAFNTADYDIWHRLAAGELFFSLGHVAPVDIFAYTPVKELWIDHEWGSGVIFFFVADRFGEAGLGWLKFGLIFLTFLPVYLMNRKRTHEPDAYRILFYVVFFYAILWGFVYTIRSQCFTYAFFAIWLYLIDLVKEGNKRILWAFPPMTIIWANLHGGFLSGLGILLLSGFPLTAFGSGLLTIINPYAFKYWEYLLDAVTMQRTFISEWKSLDLFGPPIVAMGFKIFLLMVLITLPYLIIKKRKEIKWAEILILCLTCYLSLKHVRHNVFFVIAAAAYMGEPFFQALKNYTGFVSEKFLKNADFVKRAVGSAVYAIIIISGGLTLIFIPLKINIDQKIFPVKSIEFIRENKIPGNLIVIFNWGGYALWNLYPQCKVSIDGRYEEVYPVSLVNESARFHYLGKDWQDLMNKYKTDIMLIDKSYPVYEELLALDGWTVVYTDEVSAVFMPTAKDGKHYILPNDEFIVDNTIFKSKIGETVDLN